MNNHPQNISLPLSPEAVHAQCLTTINQARNTSYALSTLIALQAFVSATVQASDRDTPAHLAIKKIIEDHAATLRTQLLAEHANALADAMRAKNCSAVTRTHGDLSRNGFWQTVQTAINKLDITERSLALNWAQSWHSDAQTRALAASGYPDALNFQKAGISPQEYAAMMDLSNCLANDTRN